MGDFLMPSLGADMDSGTVLEWRVRPGDAVHRGDIVAVVDTDKSDIEVEVFEDGVVEALLVDPGEEVAVGTPLARIAQAGSAVAFAPTAAPAAAEVEAEAAGEGALAGAVPTAVAPREPAPPAAKAAKGAKAAKATKAATKAKVAAKAKPKRPAAAPPAARTSPAPPAGPRVRSSPLARRRAAELGIDLEVVVGSGTGGAVTVADLEAAAAATPAAGPSTPAAPPGPPPAAAATTGEPTDRRGSDKQAAMRRAIADLMARSAREIPHYHLATTVDLDAALRWLVAENERRPVAERVLPAALLLKATARAARIVPALNGSWDHGFHPAAHVHLGVAVSLRGGGLVAPAIHDADELDLDDLMAALRDLVGRARAGRLRASEMSDPTITVTNLGEQGADEVLGVIYPPQVALVGFGRIVERPWATGGLLGVRPTVRATLSADHRASDGHEGSKLLAAIDRLLQAPEAL